MSPNLRVEGITKQMLVEAIKENTFWENSGIFAPFSKNKAKWIVSNERIEYNDYCGVLGYENEKLIAFVYMLPDYLNNQIPNELKAYWFPLWWVDSHYKNTVLGTYIFNEALKLANNKVIIKSYAENVDGFYSKQPFKIITHRNRYTIFVSLSPDVLIEKFKNLKHLKFFIKPLNKLIFGIVSLINHFSVKKRTKLLDYQIIETLDEQTWRFIKPLCKNDLILKTKNYIDWQLDNKQYNQNQLNYKPLVSGVSPNINIFKIKIISNNNIIGFISYVINYNELNIKYFLVKDESYFNICIDALMHFFLKSKMSYIFTDDSKISEAITKRYKTIFTYKKLKKGLTHNSILLKNSNLNLTEKDGHFY